MLAVLGDGSLGGKLARYSWGTDGALSSNSVTSSSRSSKRNSPGNSRASNAVTTHYRSVPSSRSLRDQVLPSDSRDALPNHVRRSHVRAHPQ
ncbi:hypothetical protein DXG01_006755, partial [Tephrocybe rancida]